MATRKKRTAKQPIKVKLSPTEAVIKEIVEAAQVVVVAIACIGAVCLMTYVVAMAILQVFTGTEMGRMGSIALSALVGILLAYAVAMNRDVRRYLGIKRSLPPARKKH